MARKEKTALDEDNRQALHNKVNIYHSQGSKNKSKQFHLSIYYHCHTPSGADRNRFNGINLVKTKVFLSEVPGNATRPYA